MLERIYVVRHGYRSNWSVDPQTGVYTSPVRTPTGIPADPALASYGVHQAEQLATHLLTLDPPPNKIISSPFYRCLQTLYPYVKAIFSKNGSVSVTIEPGIGEFYGEARFDHPSPAGLEELRKHFDHLEVGAKGATIVPSVKGESIVALHDRVAYALSRLIAAADQDPAGPKALLLCTHAAVVIAMGRCLTGRMPEDVGEEDFACFTCGVSEYKRRGDDVEGGEGQEGKWEEGQPVPNVGWRDGKGVAGGWECVRNSDCSFLEGGEERGWTFRIELEGLQRFAEEQAAANAAKPSNTSPPEDPFDEKTDEGKVTGAGTV